MEDNFEGYDKDNSYKIMLLICLKFKMTPIIWSKMAAKYMYFT